MNVNSIGSVIPVKNAVKAILKNIPVTAFLLDFLAANIIAKHAAGNANIIIKKKPLM